MCAVELEIASLSVYINLRVFVWILLYSSPRLPLRWGMVVEMLDWTSFGAPIGGLVSCWYCVLGSGRLPLAIVLKALVALRLKVGGCCGVYGLSV